MFFKDMLGMMGIGVYPGFGSLGINLEDFFQNEGFLNFFEGKLEVKYTIWKFHHLNPFKTWDASQPPFGCWLVTTRILAFLGWGIPKLHLNLPLATREWKIASSKHASLVSLCVACWGLRDG